MFPFIRSIIVCRQSMLREWSDGEWTLGEEVENYITTIQLPI